MIYENPLLSGSVQISGSLYVQGLRLVSSSNQIADEISGSAGIIDDRVTKLEIVSASIEGLYVPAYDYLPHLVTSQVSTGAKIISGVTYAYMLSALGLHWGASGYDPGNENNTTSLLIGDVEGDYVVNEYLDSEPITGTALPFQTRLIPRDNLSPSMIAKIQSIGLLNSSLYYLTEEQVSLFHTGKLPRKYQLNGRTEIRNTQTASLAYTASFVFNAQTAETATSLAPSAQRHNIVYVTNESTATLYATHILSASVTLSAPTVVEEGDWIKVSNRLSGVTSHISPNGNKIMGSTNTLEIDVENVGFELVYTDQKHGWVIIGQ